MVVTGPTVPSDWGVSTAVGAGRGDAGRFPRSGNLGDNDPAWPTICSLDVLWLKDESLEASGRRSAGKKPERRASSLPCPVTDVPEDYQEWERRYLDQRVETHG